MKKILTILLTSLMVFASSNAILAEETPNPTSGQVQLTATVLSTYYVLLPTTVDVSATSKTFDVKVKGDVDTAMQVVIEEDKGEQGNDVNYLVDNADGDNKFAITTSTSGAINGNVVPSAYSDDIKVTFTVTHDALAAGEYTCQLPLLISLKEIN